MPLIQMLDFLVYSFSDHPWSPSLKTGVPFAAFHFFLSLSALNSNSSKTVEIPYFHTRIHPKLLHGFVVVLGTGGVQFTGLFQPVSHAHLLWRITPVGASLTSPATSTNRNTPFSSTARSCLQRVPFLCLHHILVQLIFWSASSFDVFEKGFIASFTPLLGCLSKSSLI